MLFAVLDKEDRRVLLKDGLRARFKAEQLLFSAGDSCRAVSVVLLGRVRLWRVTPGGKLLVLRICEVGEVLGQMSALDGAPHSVNATTEVDTEVLQIEAARYRALLRARPEVAVRLATALAERVRSLSDELEAMKFLSISERILRWFDAHAADRRELKITHQALADQVGATRENVSRVLGSLKAEGVLELSRGTIEIIDHQALKRALKSQ